MKETSVTFPELGLIAGTRVVLGIGIGLLLASKLNDSHLRAVGLSMLAVGLLTTFPLAGQVLMKNCDR